MNTEQPYDTMYVISPVYPPVENVPKISKWCEIDSVLEYAVERAEILSRTYGMRVAVYELRFIVSRSTLKHVTGDELAHGNCDEERYGNAYDAARLISRQPVWHVDPE